MTAVEIAVPLLALVVLGREMWRDLQQSRRRFRLAVERMDRLNEDLAWRYHREEAYQRALELRDDRDGAAA